MSKFALLAGLLLASATTGCAGFQKGFEWMQTGYPNAWATLSPNSAAQMDEYGLVVGSFSMAPGDSGSPRVTGVAGPMTMRFASEARWESKLIYLYPGQSFAYFVRPSHWSVHAESIGTTPNQYNFGNSAGVVGGPKLFEMDVKAGQIVYVGDLELSVGPSLGGWFSGGRKFTNIARKDNGEQMRQEVEKRLETARFEFLNGVSP